MKYAKRSAVRAVLLTPEREVLLIKISDPSGTWTGWITPGGGIDEGESEIESLARELREELGFVATFKAEKLWYRTTRFVWNGEGYEQTENYFLVRVQKFEVAETLELTESEKAGFKENRWWKLEDIERVIADGSEVFAPKNFDRLLNEVVKNGPPNTAFEVG